MAIKKSELYSSLWKSCDELRGGMDASQYKDYVLVLLFIKYISDKYDGVPYAPITIPEGASFKDMVALKGKPTIGDDINKKIIGKIVEANSMLAGTLDVPDFSDPNKLGKGKDMVDRLTGLVAIFENPALDFSKNRAEGDDILGDAYEYLMRHFATESGKSKGQFYTPAEVSRIIAKIIGIDSRASPSTTAYDPTSGSGSLLLKVDDESESGLSLYGQEMDVATAALARMNMFLHNNPTAEIKQGNTLSEPLFLDNTGRLKTFDFAVSNPPFSYKAWSNGLTDENGISDAYDRFKDYGIPPKKNGDYAFLLHLISSLKSRGKGAIILPHGVLFRGNAEAGIRKKIIQRGYIKGIIGLPLNLFFGTGIPACIIVLDKENAYDRKGIFMINASKGFAKDGNKNRLREQDIHKITDVFNKQTELEKYSRMISVEEIASEKNDYSLNIPRYIDSQEDEDIQNIEAHLLGDIPIADIDVLHAYWDVCSSLKKELFSTCSREGYSSLVIENDQIKRVIYSNPEFTAYSQKVQDVFTQWKQKTMPKLKNIAIGDKPKKLINTISEDLLQYFTNLSLIDKYDMYQHLMIYWTEIMQDDVYALVDDGWEVGKEIEIDMKKKNEWEGRLIPKKLIINRYFTSEQETIKKMEADRDTIILKMEEISEENSGEEGLLEEAKNEKGKLTKTNVLKRIKEIENDAELSDELNILQQYLKLLDQESKANNKIKEANSALEKKVLDKYKVLSIEEIKTLVVDDKWLARLEQDMQTEMQRINQRLTERIKELAERYGTPLPSLDKTVDELEGKVNAHLMEMGFVWK